MKLYTEEQVDKIALQVKDLGYWNHLEITPTEIPIDEEILVPFPSEEDKEFRDGKEIKTWMDGWEHGYKEARQVILDKIQRGNQ